MKKKEKKVVTRMDEVRYKTLEPKKMLNMYLAGKVIKTYKEDFVDQDSGEVVSIDRTEPLFAKGTLINQDVLARIRFAIEAGDIKEPIEVTNQNREAYEYKNTFLQLWIAKVQVDNRCIKFLLHGQNIDNVLLILRDYIELNYKGGFTIRDVKEFKDYVILEDTLSAKIDEDDINMSYLKGEIDMQTYMTAIHTGVNENPGTKDQAKKYYQMELTVKSTDTEGEENEYPCDFICHTFDTERALVLIKAYLKMCDDERYEAAVKEDRTYAKRTFSLLIEKVAPIPIGCFIPLDFSLAYKEQ